MSYTSLIKKLSNFPKALTSTILFIVKLINGGIGKASMTPGKASTRMIFTLCNLLCDERPKNVLQRQNVNRILLGTLLDAIDSFSDASIVYYNWKRFM